MQEIYDFLNRCQTYFLATVEGNQPHVRPFGTIHLFEGRLYIQTGKSKSVSHQLAQNPQLEICAFDGTYWLRLQATAIEDDRTSARQSMLDAYPNLQALYSATDGNTQVFYLKDITATFSSFTESPRTISF